MKVFVVNCGSSSLKYQLIETDTNSALATGIADRIGMNGIGQLTHRPAGKDKVVAQHSMENHEVAIKLVLAALTDPEYGVISHLDEIGAVGHRVLHGGMKYTTSVIINESVLDAIRQYIPLGPLHNPANLIGIESCSAALPGVPQVAVFDTAFHQTMPQYAYMYALPYDYYERYSIRKYGFHGTSHRYISLRAKEMMGREDFKLITCHLGNGASCAAIVNGEVLDTSMGFTPLEGLIMGTRSGSIDPAIVKFLVDNDNKTVDEVDRILNNNSGILGISGVSNDFRDVEDAAASGNERAQLALDMFYYHVRTTIGAYIAAMDGVDMIAFTAGVGENSDTGRETIISHLSYLGVELDPAKNRKRGVEHFISTPESKVKVAVIPTNEELMIALDTHELVEKQKRLVPRP